MRGLLTPVLLMQHVRRESLLLKSNESKFFLIYRRLLGICIAYNLEINSKSLHTICKWRVTGVRDRCRSRCVLVGVADVVKTRGERVCGGGGGRREGRENARIWDWLKFRVYSPLDFERRSRANDSFTLTSSVAAPFFPRACRHFCDNSRFLTAKGTYLRRSEDTKVKRSEYERSRKSFPSKKSYPLSRDK